MQHDAMIEEYAAGGARLREALDGLTTGELNAFPVPGTWSLRQITVHLLHAELFAVGRMCRIVAEDVPLLMDWDENTFVARLRYDALPIDDVITCFDTLRRTMAATLRQLKDEDFARYGIHSKKGKMTLEEIVLNYTRHLDHHLEFIKAKRDLIRPAVAR
jgi:hypothetical protein